MQPLTLSVQEVAEALGVSPRTFLDRRPALTIAGFPRPLPGFRSQRWSRAQVEAWAAAAEAPSPLPRAGADGAQRQVRGRNAEAGDVPPSNVIAMREALEARYARRPE